MEAYETHSALRGPKQPPPGVRPGSLVDPGPQRSDRSQRRSAGNSLPTLALPVLAGSAGEVVDYSSLRFLTASALEARREEEERKQKERKDKEHEAHLAKWLKPAPKGSPSFFGPVVKRKRKKRRKRRKRRAPRTSSRSSCGRARRRQRQWHARSAGLPGDVLLRAVFPEMLAVVFGPEMLGIMAVLYQKDSTTLVVNHGSGMCRVGFTGHDPPRVMFPSGVARPKMLRILAGMDQKDRCSGIYMAGIACDNAPRAVFSSLVRRLFPGPHGPESAESCGVHTGAVLGRGCVHARCWATTRPHGTDSSETRGVPTGAVLVRGCVHARCWATTRPHGTDSSETHGVPTGAVLVRGCVHARCWATTRLIPVEFPQVQSSPLLWRRDKSPWSR